eukprot:CAMPEP_0115531094 /NCGR_PEP_ID=MMETSP0271-20121206/84851_1 /TAXON_ID=71861 /ORGANISM="Scrippsiella trochoidea, Strain CCMP3099" /LENGTH=36 /DNA_ID= /DNA_START= /DNA_END= /DNA_ORIENTATION=
MSEAAAMDEAMLWMSKVDMSAIFTTKSKLVVPEAKS